MLQVRALPLEPVFKSLMCNGARQRRGGKNALPGEVPEEMPEELQDFTIRQYSGIIAD
jgi:hypothetical protein